MIDWITAIIPCHHDEKIYGGTIASVNIDGEIEWRVEKKKQVRGSNESNLNIKSLSNTEILLDGNLAKWLDFPEFSRHSIMSKLNWRVMYERYKIYS